MGSFQQGVTERLFSSIYSSSPILSKVPSDIEMEDSDSSVNCLEVVLDRHLAAERVIHKCKECLQGPWKLRSRSSVGDLGRAGLNRRAYLAPLITVTTTVTELMLTDGIIESFRP